MRLYALLILLAVALAFSAGFLSLSIRNAPRTTQGSAGDIVQLKAKFQREHRSEAELVLPSLFPASDYSQLVDPNFALPQNRRFSFRAVSRLFRYSQTCSGQIERGVSDPILRKSWLWQRYKCGKLHRLPEDFFESAPFTSVLGGSFAFHAVQSPERIKLTNEWIQNHIQFFHVSELPALAQFQVSVEEARQILASLDADSLKAVSDSDELILGERFVLFRKMPGILSNTDSSGLLGRATYIAFKRQEWDLALAESDYRAEVLRDGQLCLLREGQVCWRMATDEVFRTIQGKTLVLFLFAALMTTVCTLIAIRKFQQQKLEEERKRFALQTLTHELRTPLASLVVSSEEVIDRFDSIPHDLQGTMVRMCDDIQRLHRLAEISKHYLGSESSGRLIQFNFQVIPSVNAYLKALLEPFEGKVTFTLLAQDQTFSLDTYWVGVCIKNLIENSLQHGKPPVRLVAEVRGDALEIAVEDAGICFSPKLDTLVQPFTKGTASRGLGLGLAIVKKVVESMSADLAFASNPTRFSLRIHERRGAS